MSGERRLLQSLFDSAVASAQPSGLIPGRLPCRPPGKTTVIGAGKAAASMARAVEDNWPDELSGLVVVPYGHSIACQRIEVIEAGHPVPDASGLDATRRIVASVGGRSGEDLILCLLSGGGSALLTMPACGLNLEDKQAVTAALLRSGANIAEMNCVRKHLSATKGGRLAAACSPARILTLAISDVPGNDPSVIASGPTVPDPTSREMAMEILERYAQGMPDSVMAYLRSPAAETPKPGDPVFGKSETVILATADDAMQAAARAARELNIEPLLLGDLQGDAGEIAAEHAALAKKIAAGAGPVHPPCVLISGGETTVKLRGRGRGGRNSEYCLALVLALRGHAGIHAIACDTDGIDGTGDNAGCFVTPDSLHHAREKSLDAESLLRENDSYRFFSKLGDLVLTGPTRTNVNDFRAILIAR